MKNKLPIIAFSLLALLWVGGCESDPTISKSAPVNKTVLDVIQANGYTEFVKAVKVAGLETEVNSASKQTIFAPNNAAFNVLLKQLSLSKVEEIDPALLTSVLRYHISTEDSYTSALLPRKVASIGGKNIYLTQKSASVNASGTIVLKDRSGNNGTFHGINLVLSPPTLSIYNAIAARAAGSPAEFTLLKYAIDKAGLASVLQNGDFTLFAPTDAAMSSAGLGTTSAIDALSTVALKEALQYHVLPGAQFSIELTTSRVATVNGGPTGSVKGMDVNAATSAFESGTISNANQLATNGVWHQINSFASPKVGIKEGITVTGVNLFAPNDGLGPDAFGALITASGYSRFDDINRATKDAIYFPRVPPAPASFASNAAIIQYIERHVFPPTVNITTAVNGTKITSIGGDEYYVAENATGGRFVNGVAASRNAFGSASTINNVVYDGTVYIWGTTGYSGLVPLSKSTIVQMLAADPQFTLIAAAIKKVGKESFLSTGNKTFFAVDNTAFTAATALASEAAINALDPASALFASIANAIDRSTVNSAEFNVRISSVLPILKNALNEDVVCGTVGGNVVIIQNIQRPDTNFVSFVTFDKFLAKNGVVHIVNKFIKF